MASGTPRSDLPRRRRSAAVLALCLLSGGPIAPAAALADETAATPLDSCMDKAASRLDMIVCVSAEARAATERVDKAYAAVACHLDTDGKAALAASQEAWTGFRDADCAFWSGGGGTVARMNEQYCLIHRSNDRTAELDRWPPNAPRDALAPCEGK